MASGLKQTIFNHLPPATLAVVWAIFAFVPTSLAQSEALLGILALGALVFIQAMEFVSERHASWRLNWREAFTDLFYVAFGIFIIGSLS